MKVNYVCETSYCVTDILMSVYEHVCHVSINNTRQDVTINVSQPIYNAVGVKFDVRDQLRRGYNAS